MKKQILVLIAFMFFFATVKAQVINDEDFTGATMVLDSTITNDMKLMIAADRLFAKNGLIEAIVNEASKEKAETGEIKKAQATQKFLDDVKADYQKFAMKFIKVDTVRVNVDSINAEIVKIQNWQQKVVNDPEVENATSLSVWKRKSERLEKLLYYKRQIK